MTANDIRNLANLYKSPRASAAEQLTHEVLDALADVVKAAEAYGCQDDTGELWEALGRLEALKP